LYGNVDVRDAAVGFRVPGRLTEMNAEEGDRVRAGEVIAALDREPYRESLDQAEAELQAARARLRKVQTGNRPQEIEQARAQVSDLETELDNARRLYRRHQELLASGAVSKQAVDDRRTARDRLRAKLARAREGLDLAREGFREEDISEARANLRAALARRKRALTDLEDTELVAPADANVLSRVREPGAVVNAGSTIYNLSVEDPIWVRTYVSEPELGKVYPGQEALVYTDTKPEKPYRGHVGFISPQAEFTPKNVQTTQLRTDLVYRLRVVVDDPDRGLRQGMPVTVEIRPEVP
jgi:HlyD family secretion protein